MIASRLPVSMTVCLTAVVAILAATPTHAQSPLPTQRELAPFGLQRTWWGQAVVDSDSDEVQYVSSDEDNVYVQTRAGLFTAFNAETGKRLWSALIGSSREVCLPISTNERQVLAAVGLKLFAINKFTGVANWTLPLPRYPSAPPELDSDQTFIGMVDGSVYAYDLRTIRQLETEGRLPRFAEDAFLWKYQAPAEITSSPISNGRAVIFASLNGTVFSIASRENQLNFEFEANAKISTPIGRASDSLYVASEDSRLYCLNAQDGPQSGARRWVFTAGVPIRKQPIAIGGSVFIAPERDGLYSLNTASGVIRWHQPLATEFVAATEDYLFASDELGNLLLLGHNDGAVVGRLRLRHLSMRVNNDRTDRVYLATPRGLIVCLRERGQEFPIYHKFPERRPILPEMAPDEPDEPAAVR